MTPAVMYGLETPARRRKKKYPIGIAQVKQFREHARSKKKNKLEAGQAIRLFFFQEDNVPSNKARYII